MSISTLEIGILLVTQCVTGLALLKVRLLSTPVQVASWAALAELGAAPPLSPAALEQRQPGPAVPAHGANSPAAVAVAPVAAEPPSMPADWSIQDREIGRVVRLNPTPGGPFKGETRCGCGGAWRYMVSGTATDPVWRCLHCGNLFAGDALIPQSPTSPEAWAKEDRELGNVLLLKDSPSVPFTANSRCTCGGTWRYVLGGSATDSIWRCLHCGHVFVGEDPIPWN